MKIKPIYLVGGAVALLAVIKLPMFEGLRNKVGDLVIKASGGI